MNLLQGREQQQTVWERGKEIVGFGLFLWIYYHCGYIDHTLQSGGEGERPQKVVFSSVLPHKNGLFWLFLWLFCGKMENFVTDLLMHAEDVKHH